MDVFISLDGNRDIVGQIYRQLRAAILDGRLKAGQALPPTRELASTLKVSRNSVLAAYNRLSEGGMVVSRVGSGSFVAPDAPRDAPEQRGHVQTPLRPKAFWDTLPELEYLDKTVVTYDFRTGRPDASLFPYSTWRRLVMHELRATNRRAGKYGDPVGLLALRAAIARHVSVSRGVHANQDNITITSGTQQALDLIARLFLNPGDCVAVEEPGYPLARLLFESHGTRISTVKLDADGLDVEALPEDAKLIYLTPSHQYPMGMAMSVERRHALLSWAEHHNAIIIEDDYDCEYWYNERPVETLQSLDRTGRVLYVGSFSKTMLPSIRVGFIAAPSSLAPAMRRAKLVTDWGCPITTQAALATFIDTGLLAAHLRRMRQEYQQRRAIILRTLRRNFTEWLTPISASAGLHLATIATELDVESMRVIQKKALAADVAVSCLASYYRDPPYRSGLLFGFGSLATANITEGLERLHQCFLSSGDEIV